jgi:hypothetical protein
MSFLKASRHRPKGFFGRRPKAGGPQEIPERPGPRAHESQEDMERQVQEKDNGDILSKTPR